MRDRFSEGIRIDVVGVVSSPFAEKFGIPRQPGLVEHAVGEVRLTGAYGDPATLQGLEDFSHVWLIYQFDRCVEQGWRPRVRPPRLGGNREVGVWASRAPFRPNFLGLSVVRLLEVVTSPAPVLRVSGIDLLDGTPVFDIKPYLPYVDAVTDARGGYADERPRPTRAVRFGAQARADLAASADPSGLEALVTEVLAFDPRPAYRQGEPPGRIYGMLLAGRNVRWRIVEDAFEVLDLAPAPAA